MRTLNTWEIVRSSARMTIKGLTEEGAYVKVTNVISVFPNGRKDRVFGLTAAGETIVLLIS